MNIQLAGATQIDGVWPAVRKQIEQAIIKGNADDITIADVYAHLRSGHWFLFVADDLSASLVLKFERTTKGEAARIVTHASEKPDDWAVLIKEILRFAKQNGATRLVFEGRKGWERKVPQMKLARCVYEMELG